MKFQSEPIEEHAEVPARDGGQWEELLSHWDQRERGPKARPAEGNRSYVVSAHFQGEPHPAGRLQEILGLVEAQGDRVVGYESLLLPKIDPRTYLGKGRSEDIADRAREEGADLLVVDIALSPSQTRNLEDLTGLAVCDREAVILNVFEKHARTRSARIQVEIAHLEYLRPRIRGLGLSMDQQAGGIMGSRGPGETASELLARKLDARLAALRKGLQRLERQSIHQRKQRRGCPRIALVGYTNAGKSSLMNALTAADSSVRDRPFETLDTTTRCLTRHGGEVLLSDTVGFIRDLPQRLFASFASTLSEIGEASLLVVVLDATDPELDLHLHTTEAILQQLDAWEIPRLYLLNKLDLCAPSALEAWQESRQDGREFRRLSARDPDQVEDLKQELLDRVRGQRVSLFVPYAASQVMSRIYGACQIYEAEPEAEGMRFRIQANAEILEQLQRALEEVQR